jgi:ATP-dependent DNA helicase DinG
MAMFEFKPKQSDTETLQQLYDDLSQGKWDGERDSLESPLRDELWNSIVSDKHSCNNGLPHHRGCPFQKARSELDRADVLVANHSLVMADLDLGGGVVLSEPNNTFYVFDEAHHLPRVCRDHSSASASLKGGASWLESLNKQLPKIIGLTDESRSSRFKNELQNHIAQLIPQLTQLSKRFNANEFHEGVYRFEHGLLPDWLQAESKELKGHSEKALQAVGKISDLIAERVKDGQVSSRLAEPAMAELGFYVNRLENFTKVWQLMAEPPREKGAPLARWLEHITDKDDFLVSVSPLEVGWQLDKMLWSQCVGAVLVSATMRALNSFNYFAREAGLSTDEKDGIRYLALASPFDYPNNAELIVPSFPCEPQADEYTQHLSEQLDSWIVPDKANLILFSSYWQMNKVADSVQKSWTKKGWALQLQGETSRSAILKKHAKLTKQGKTSVLFGTGSFSEGLDLPGELLENVVITKIPFGVPTSPVEQAHTEYITDKGGNAFMQIAVPEASKKLIQAAGRLLRKEQDSGRVVILDRRVVTKRYGKLLLDSLPPFKRTIQR